MPWKPGESGNPAGRPRGTRDRLSKAVIEELLTDWSQHGVEVIERVREENPAQYLAFIGRVLPQQTEIDVTDSRRSIVEFTSAELASMLVSDTAQITDMNTAAAGQKAVST